MLCFISIFLVVRLQPPNMQVLYDNRVPVCSVIKLIVLSSALVTGDSLEAQPSCKSTHQQTCTSILTKVTVACKYTSIVITIAWPNFRPSQQCYQMPQQEQSMFMQNICIGLRTAWDAFYDCLIAGKPCRFLIDIMHSIHHRTLSTTHFSPTSKQQCPLQLYLQYTHCYGSISHNCSSRQGYLSHKA